MKPKFKTGDIVRILDGSHIEDYTRSFTFSMRPYVGTTGQVLYVKSYDGDRYAYVLKGMSYYWDERGLELVTKPETIVIYRKDREVIALDKTTGKKGIAKCDLRDEFDFEIGAKLALERVFESEEPKGYSGRVVCIDDISKHFTVGKIYEVKDGVITFDDGAKSIKFTGENFKDWVEYFSSKFIEIKE